LKDTSIWGPTCDPKDFISKSLKLPLLDIDDWMIFKSWGAYTLSCETNFNGMKAGKIFNVNDVK